MKNIFIQSLDCPVRNCLLQQWMYRGKRAEIRVILDLFSVITAIYFTLGELHMNHKTRSFSQKVSFFYHIMDVTNRQHSVQQ